MANVSSSNSLGERVPKLRFPGFEGEWTCEKLSEFAEKVTRKNTNNETELPLTISSKDGLVDQISYFNKTVASRDMSGYYLLKQGEYAYNKSYSVGFNFGSIKRLDRYPMGALSTLYICFSLKKHNPDFIKTYFDSLKWYHEIHMIAAEGARNHGLLNVPTEDFFETKHWFPANMDEQKKIANFFELLEYRIEIQQKFLEALKLYKRGLLARLFPQKGESVPRYRFKGFTDTWEQRELRDIVGKTYGGGTPKTNINEYWNGEIPWIQSSNLLEHELFNANIQKHISKTGLQKSAAQLVPKNSIAVVSHVGVGKLVFMPFEYTTSQDFISLSELKTEPFFTCYILYKRLQSDIHIVQGSAIKGITKTDLLSKKIKMPKILEQEKIGAALKKFDCLITFYQRKYNTYYSLKKSLLQKMFI